MNACHFQHGTCTAVTRTVPSMRLVLLTLLVTALAALGGCDGEEETAVGGGGTTSAGTVTTGGEGGTGGSTGGSGGTAGSGGEAPPRPCVQQIPPPGDDYFVALAGDDGNDGSDGQPWRTLHHAASVVAPDESHTIHLGAGTFEETGSPVDLPSGVNLIGAGRQETIYRGEIRLLNANQNQTIASFTMDGWENKNSSSQIYEALDVGTDSYCITIHDMLVEGFYGSGVVLGGEQYELYDSEFNNNARHDAREAGFILLDSTDSRHPRQRLHRRRWSRRRGHVERTANADQSPALSSDHVRASVDIRWLGRPSAFCHRVLCGQRLWGRDPRLGVQQRAVVGSDDPGVR